VRISAKRMLDVASYALRLSPAPRPDPVSPLGLASEHYKAVASSQHLDATLARYRQSWITEPETLDSRERQLLAHFANAAVYEILQTQPDKEKDLSLLAGRIDRYLLYLSDYEWQRFREELLRVLPDLDDPVVPAAEDTYPQIFASDAESSSGFDQGAPMDFSAKLENLKAKVNETVETARAAAAENRDQLKQRVDQAQDDANKAMEEAKQQAEETADRAKSKWAQMKADAAARREDMKAKINKRADQLDAKAAATDADWAEQDAADAIDYAILMVQEAQLAVLDALDARAYADERAKVAGK
jgi:hypothetical protein